jgi:hypothetical protein
MLCGRSGTLLETTTPKALANFSPELKRSDNSGFGPSNTYPTLKGFAARRTPSGLTAVFIHSIPELERSDNSGFRPSNTYPTLKGFAARRTPSGLTAVFIHSIPELSLRSNPGLKLANAFGVFV